MNLEKLAPWNWFKKEEEEDRGSVPIRRAATEASAGGYGGLTRPLHDEIDRVFDSFFRGFGFPGFGGGLATSPSSWLRPSLDLSASEKEYTVTVELPGVDKDDVEVELSGNSLLIKGEKKHEQEESKKDFYRLERSYGAFQRTLSLPEDADRDNIDAKFRRGVMTLTIPRRAAAPANRRVIEIQGR